MKIYKEKPKESEVFYFEDSQKNILKIKVNQFINGEYGLKRGIFQYALTSKELKFLADYFDKLNKK